MSNVVRWDPFTDLRVTMDRLFDDSFARPRRRIVSAREFAAMVPVEVSETEAAIEVKARSRASSRKRSTSPSTRTC